MGQRLQGRHCVSVGTRVSPTPDPVSWDLLRRHQWTQTSGHVEWEQRKQRALCPMASQLWGFTDHTDKTRAAGVTNLRP